MSVEQSGMSHTWAAGFPQSRDAVGNHGWTSRESADVASRREPYARAMSRRQRILIAGGGVAALETMFALRELAGAMPDIHVVSSEPEFLYRPVTVAEPFGCGEARSYSLNQLTAHAGATLRQAELTAVDPDARTAITTDGALPYDTLVVAIGARQHNPLPGAVIFGGRADVEPLRALLADIGAGRVRSVVFTFARERAWSLPIYELALMTAQHARSAARRTAVTVVTPEEEPLSLFGPEAARALLPILRSRGVSVRCLSRPERVEPGAVVLAGGARVHTDRVVTLPVCDGPFLPGLPHDAEGFISVDRHSQVVGVDDVYAAGDITNFPLKQGGLAAQQADAAAEAIAATLGIPLTPQPFQPVLRGLLLTGGAPLYLRAEPHRLRRGGTVAIDPTPLHPSDDATAASDEALWWPPAKIAGRWLAPQLAASRPVLRSDAALVDRAKLSGPSPAVDEAADAAELALLLAEGDARWGDFSAALAALESAAALGAGLPHEYELKRRRWEQARRHGE
jgi:sulfide:quinone oxidoreductase